MLKTPKRENAKTWNFHPILENRGTMNLMNAKLPDKTCVISSTRTVEPINGFFK